jgi:serine/threonine protein kinase
MFQFAQTATPRSFSGLRLDPIGRGAQGKVHKLFLPSGDLAALKIYSRFAKVRSCLGEIFDFVSSFDRPGIVKILDYGDLDDDFLRSFLPAKRFFVLMDYLGDTDFKKHLLRTGPHSINVSSDLSKIAASLALFHNRRRIFVDLKPDNLMITPRGPVLIDFEQVQPAGSVSHTVTYFLAPENVSGKPLTPKTDIYSLGLTSFEILTGLSAKSTRVMSLESMARALDSCGVGYKLSGLVLSMSDPDPHKRPNDMSFVCDALSGI